MSKGGRPKVVFNDERVAKVEALAAVCTKGQIADYFGISEKTLRAVEDRQPEVFTAYKKGKAKAIENVGQGLLQAALDGNMTAAIFYLKTQAGWSEKMKFDSEGIGDIVLNLGGSRISPDDLGW
jgi:hypothetical protein